MHKFACTNVTPKIKKIKIIIIIINKRLQVAFTHARVHMGASVYSPGPEED